jgi:hypothetical protein
MTKLKSIVSKLINVITSKRFLIILMCSFSLVLCLSSITPLTEQIKSIAISNATTHDMNIIFGTHNPEAPLWGHFVVLLGCLIVSLFDVIVLFYMAEKIIKNKSII